MILALRTDKPQAELWLLDQKGKEVAAYEWQAHRELADTLLQKIVEFLTTNKLTMQDLSGIVVFKGPGSFTGLRIGVTVANALAYTCKIPVVGAMGEQDWRTKGLELLQAGKNEAIVLPEYGREANITLPKK